MIRRACGPLLQRVASLSATPEVLAVWQPQTSVRAASRMTAARLSEPVSDPMLEKVASQAMAVAVSNPRDASAQLAYLSVLYRLNRNRELLEHASSGLYASDRRIQELANAASVKVSKRDTPEAQRGASSPPARGYASSSRSAAASGFSQGPPAYGQPPPGGYGYPPHPPSGGYGYPPPGGYGYPSAPPPPPGGYGYPSAPPPPPGGYGYPSAPPSAPPSSASDSSSDEGNRPTKGTQGNPLFVRTVSSYGWSDFLRQAVTMLLFGGLLVAVSSTMSPMGGGKGGGLGDLLGGKANEPVVVPDTRFGDVRGVDEAKEELKDLVEYLRNPERFIAVGAHIPKGVLLTGPPGTGKTLLARAVAGEAGVKFFAKSASEFEEMLVGLGARRVREMFEQARKEAPAIIFIDEIDAMGAKRGRVSLGSGAERQTLNQLLACMDGFEKGENVVVIAATNNPEILDAALIRPGRFDSQVSVPLPDINGRREILDLYLSKVPVGEGVDPQLLAAATPGMSGAAIATMVNTAAIEAAKAGRKAVSMEDLEEARDKTWMGPAMRSRRRTAKDLELTAYHEGGHTIASLLTRGAAELHKVTVLQRGNAGGITFFLDDESQGRTRQQLLAQLDVAMGGRVAEEMIYGRDLVTTGASADMQQASNIARRYVMAFAMGDHGMAVYTSNSQDRDSEPSPEVKARIDSEVELLLNESHERVKALLASNRDKLERLARALLEHETLTAEEARMVVLEGASLPPPQELAKQRREQATRLAKERMARIAQEERELAELKGQTPPGETKKGGLWGMVFGGKEAEKEEPEAPVAEPEEEEPKKPGKRWV
jgi:ATP-dependent metalloprotease FtsH